MTEQALCNAMRLHGGAVDRLAEKLRTAVHLYYAEGYATEEIAALLGVPPATVRTRLRRARLKLKDLLGGNEDGE